MPSFAQYTFIRVLRALRPLRTLRFLPGMPVLIGSIFKSIPQVSQPSTRPPRDGPSPPR